MEPLLPRCHDWTHIGSQALYNVHLGFTTLQDTPRSTPNSLAQPASNLNTPRASVERMVRSRGPVRHSTMAELTHMHVDGGAIFRQLLSAFFIFLEV
jgi:hypothetical protein